MLYDVPVSSHQGMAGVGSSRQSIQDFLEKMNRILVNQGLQTLQLTHDDDSAHTQRFFFGKPPGWELKRIHALMCTYK